MNDKKQQQPPLPTLLATPRRPALLAEHDNTLEVLVRLQAPDAPAELPQRNPLHLALVIDRSGSMSGRPLAEARRCAEFVLDGLLPTDRLSLVVYDDDVDTLVPAVPVGDGRHPTSERRSATAARSSVARSARSRTAAPPTCTAAGIKASQRCCRTSRHRASRA